MFKSLFVALSLFVLFSCGVTSASAQPAGLPSGTWTLCGSENTQCNFTGTALVEFGATGNFTGLTLTNGTLCSDMVFGDPDVGVFKSCYYQLVSGAPLVTGLPSGTWTYCANEWGQCSFTGQALVEFGASGHFSGLTLNNGTLCANTIFGDPDVGVAKGCYFQTVVQTPPPVAGLPAGSWTFCANEWGQCSFTGQALVEFGASGHFAGLTLNNGTLCANTIFGDPDVGVAKGCYYQPTSVVTVAVVPANVSATYGATQQFSATVTGETNPALTWALSGAGCNTTSCGTLSSSGLYTAPAVLPSSANVAVTATSVADPSVSGSGYLSIVGRTYYLANAAGGGSDSNNGLSATTPWLTPSHTLNCGDVILAAPGIYSAPHFNLIFGAVNCPTQNNVAWLKCAVFDGCKISAPQSGIWINQSYWGVEGWEVTTTGGQFSPCFYASPGSSSSPTIHHIVFANDIANGCYGSGFAISNQGVVGVDYYAVVGSIVYNSVQGGAACFSGMNIAAPVQSDTLPGTHIYVAGVYDWDNFEPATCNGGAPTDGEGIILDTLDADSYSQQVVVENTISFLNGSSGIKVGVTTMATVHIQNNTLYGNNGDSQIGNGECGEIVSQGADNVTTTHNLIRTNANGCAGGPSYGLFVQTPYAGDVFDNNFVYSPAGNNTGQSGGFTFGTGNIFGTDPSFANAPLGNPGPPVCSSYSNVASCMATEIANFTPTNPAAAIYGYQAPRPTPVYDPLFPQWLCNVNLPEGLIQMGCQTGQ
jgi:hypothetical protein